MGYWMVGQVRTMITSLLYKNKLKMGEKSLVGSSWCHVRCSWGTTWGLTGAFLCLVVVGLSLLDLGIQFDKCGSIRSFVPGLLVSLGIDVEMGQEGLDIALVLDGQNSSSEVFSEGRILVSVSLAWWLSASSTSSWGTSPLPVIFWIVAYPLSFSSVVFLIPPILFSFRGFIYYYTFWLFQYLSDGRKRMHEGGRWRPMTQVLSKG